MDSTSPSHHRPSPTLAPDIPANAPVPPELSSVKEPKEPNEPNEPDEHLVLEHPPAQSDRPTTPPLNHAPPPRVILIALDGSHHAARALAYAHQHIIRRDDLVLLVHVRTVNTLIFPRFSIGHLQALNELDTYERLIAHKLVVRAGTWLKNQGHRRLKGITVRGEPRADLLSKADAYHADIIVVGSRGLGAVKRIFLGSVSEYLVNNASCPVVVVRPPPPLPPSTELPNLEYEPRRIKEARALEQAVEEIMGHEHTSSHGSVEVEVTQSSLSRATLSSGSLLPVEPERDQASLR